MMGKLKKISLISAISIAVISWSSIAIIIFYPTILNLVFRDTAPINDSDLRLEKITVEKGDNAYYDLVKIENNLKGSSEDFKLVANHLDGKTWDKNFVGKLLSKNKQALEYFDAAYQKPKFQDPAYADPAEISLETSLVPFKPAGMAQVSQLNSLRALRLAKQGKAVEAYDKALKPAIIGQKIHESQVNLVHFLIGSAMKAIALEAEQQLLNYTNVSSKTLTQYIQKLEKLKNNKEGLETALKGEYHIQLNAISAPLFGRGRGTNSSDSSLENITINFFNLDRTKSSFYFQPNKTKALFAGYTREAISNLDKPCSTVKYKEIERPSESFSIKLLFTENAVGKMIHDIVAISLGKINNRRCEENLLISSTQLLFALKAYKNDTDGLPNSLDQLVPKYLSDVLRDPYDGEAIRYDATKKIIYSVGNDGIDSGGSEGEDWSKMKDPTFRIDF